MHTHSKHDTMLMLRPSLGPASGGNAYAHFDAIPVRKEPGASYGRYADNGISHKGDDGRRVLHLDNFRFHCQIDDRQAESYRWPWGYRPDRREIFTQADLDRSGPSIATLSRRMDKFRREDEDAATEGRLIARLARAMKLDGIAALETSTNGALCDGLNLSWRAEPKDYGQAIVWIDDLVASLHPANASRIDRFA